MKSLLLIAQIFLALTAISQYNPPWFNDPQWVPDYYMTDQGYTMRHQTYSSTLHSENIGFWIALPPAYLIDSTVEYPVVYWLHGGATGGLNENAMSWYVDDEFEEAVGPYPTFHNAIHVFANGCDMSFWTDMPDQSVQLESSFVTELIPHLNSNYSISGNRSCSAVAGFSMGGFAAIKYLFKYPQMFSTAISIDGSIYPSLSHDPNYVNDPAHAWYLSLAFDNDQTHMDANSVYTWSDDYFQSNSSLPIQLLILAGESEPLENYAATSFVNYLNATHSFAPVFDVTPNLPHDLSMFFSTYDTLMYNFLDQNLCDTSSVSTGDVVANIPLAIYPNPVTTTARLDQTVTGWEVFNLSGQMLLDGTGNEINVMSLSPGTYLVLGRSELGTFTARMVVE